MSSRTISVRCPWCGMRHSGLTADGGLAKAPCGAYFNEAGYPFCAPSPVPDKPIASFKASELLAGATMQMTVKLQFDWRFRLGLALVKLGVRIMGACPSVKEPMSRPAVEEEMVIGHSVELEAGDSPRLMLVYKERLSPAAIEGLRAAWTPAFTGPERKPIAIDEDPDIFQLVDGRWQPLRTPDREPDEPTPG